MKGKQEEREAKKAVIRQKQQAAEAHRNEQVNARMVAGALLKISGLPKADKGW